RPRHAEAVEHPVVVGVRRGMSRDPGCERPAEDGEQEQQDDDARGEHRRLVLAEPLPEEPRRATRLGERGAAGAEEVGCRCHGFVDSPRKVRSLPSTGGKYRTALLRQELVTASYCV